jgi:isopenicillin N synthase-like dioxygenase
MRMLHYPGIPPDQVKEENPGIGAHTGQLAWTVTANLNPDPADFECFTILAQGGPGLQVQNRQGQCEFAADMGWPCR